MDVADSSAGKELLANETSVDSGSGAYGGQMEFNNRVNEKQGAET